MKCAVKECNVDLCSNAEQSVHYNLSHRGASYKDLFNGITIEDYESDTTGYKSGKDANKSGKDTNGNLLHSKMDKQIRKGN